jgi:hypothetical protein
MKTQVPVTSDFRPSLAEHPFDFRVASTPSDKVDTYEIKVRSQDFRDLTLTLYYRRNDFSLEKVTRQNAGEATDIIIQNGHYPFIYYERRLPIIPDFPMGGVPQPAARQNFTVAGYQVIQDFKVSNDVAQITFERIEPLGSLRVAAQWVAGDPWWSKIECSENPPPNAPFGGQVVASGQLLK